MVKGRQETEITRWIGKRQLENKEGKNSCVFTAHRDKATL